MCRKCLVLRLNYLLALNIYEVHSGILVARWFCCRCVTRCSVRPGGPVSSWSLISGAQLKSQYCCCTSACSASLIFCPGFTGIFWVGQRMMVFIVTSPSSPASVPGRCRAVPDAGTLLARKNNNKKTQENVKDVPGDTTWVLLVQIDCHECSVRWACLNMTVFYWQLLFWFVDVEPSVTLSLVALHGLLLASWIQVPLLGAVIGPWTLIHSHFAPINSCRADFLLSSCRFLGTGLVARFAAGRGSKVLSHNGNVSLFWVQWENQAGSQGDVGKAESLWGVAANTGF